MSQQPRPFSSKVHLMFTDAAILLLVFAAGYGVARLDLGQAEARH